MPDAKVSYVFSSSDYGGFKKLNGNRSVLDQRVTRILNSIKERGWIRNPIIINEKREIIDGQGRFEALQRLGMPIEYVISEGATIDDCIALNIKQQNWKPADYIRCYAEMGSKDYQKLEKLIADYKSKLLQNSICSIAADMSPSGTFNSCIQSGRLRISSSDDDLKKKLDFASEAMKIIGTDRGRERTWIGAFRFLCASGIMDMETMLEKLRKYVAMLSVSVNTEQALAALDKIYNYNARGDRVYFVAEFDKYKRDTFRNRARSRNAA